MPRSQPLPEQSPEPSEPNRGSDARRSAILAAALELFGRYGYRRTSVEDIAREAGVAKGTVYLYADSKEALFRSLTESIFDQILEAAGRAAQADAPLEERLFEVLRARFSYLHGVVRQSPHASELLDSKNRTSADLCHAHEDRYRAIVAKLLADAVRRQEIAPKAQTLTAANLVDVLLAGAQGLSSTQGLGAETTRTVQEYDQLLQSFVRLIVAGIAPSNRAKS